MKVYLPSLRNKGFSLIELLISILISLMVLAGVVQLVFNSKRSYLDNQEMSYLQDNTRFVMDILSREIRMAGYKGCASEGANVVSIIRQDILPNVLGLSNNMGFLPLQGFENPNVPAEFTNRVADTDSLLVWHGGTTNPLALLTDNYNNRQLTLNNSNGFASDYKVGMPAMVIDAQCRNVGVFAVTAQNVGLATLNYQSANNNCADASFRADTNCAAQANALSFRTFAPGSRIVPYVAAGYYIGDSRVRLGMRALKRMSIQADNAGNLSAATDEIAQGVTDMQLSYGVLTNGQGVGAMVEYRDAPNVNNWNNVVAVRMALTFQAEGSQWQVQGAPLTKTLTSTIQIRNRF